MLFGNEIITSRQNPTVVKLCALLDKKERRKSRLFRIDGHKLFSEAIECGAEIELVALSADKADRFKPLTARSGAKTILLSPEVFSKITDEKAPDGIIAVVKYIDGLHKVLSASDIPAIAASDRRIMAFESLRDPGNLGTVLRTASAFGCNTVILSGDCADIYNPKTIRASMGAVFRQKTLRSTDLVATIKNLRDCGKTVYAATLDEKSRSLFDIRVNDSVCFVVGNEGNGIRGEVICACDGSVIIPMENGTESLNAATAATILLYEAYRQR